MRQKSLKGFSAPHFSRFQCLCLGLWLETEPKPFNTLLMRPLYLSEPRFLCISDHYCPVKYVERSRPKPSFVIYKIVSNQLKSQRRFRPWHIVTQSLVRCYNLFQDMISSRSKKTAISLNGSIAALIDGDNFVPCSSHN